jgi:hypothetical protein
MALLATIEVLHGDDVQARIALARAAALVGDRTERRR